MVIIMKKGKIFIFLILLIILVIGGYFGYNKFFGKRDPGKKAETIDNIDKYGYKLNDNASNYYKKLFKELKTILNKETVDDEEYAKKISQLFVTDLFTLSNKLTSSDVGGLDFVYKDFHDDFIAIAQSSLYSSVKSNIYGDRKQELPEVSDVTVIKSKKEPFKIGDKTYDNAYTINVEIKYVKDLGYPKKYNVVVINNEPNMEIVKSYE